jgi:hypothetical protein
MSLNADININFKATPHSRKDNRGNKEVVVEEGIKALLSLYFVGFIENILLCSNYHTLYTYSNTSARV